jgi:hypothetical protein
MMPSARSPIPFPLLLATSVVLFLAACERDEDEPNVTPTIAFVQESGYTWANDTVGTTDTLKVGVRVARGTNGLDLFKVTVVYDNGPEQTVDSVAIGSDDLEYEKTIITRAEPGTELWRFNVIESDGDLIRRSITLTVQ